MGKIDQNGRNALMNALQEITRRPIEADVDLVRELALRTESPISDAPVYAPTANQILLIFPIGENAGY
jgi:hypothetical protein